MTFSGDLDHLSIIDVVQLMHASRKSGTLAARGRRGECQLVFSDGAIISANHCDEDVRIGRVLVEAKVISEEALEEALREQREGDPRRPLIATLIESGRVKKEIAYRGLETLIHLTIVEILTWRGGTFSLDPEKVLVTDDYRYFPERLHQSVQFNTEYMLMDALRIYDEKKRAGLLREEEPGGAAGAAQGSGAAAQAPLISADLLGLGDLERLSRKIPDVYLGLEDRPSSAPARAKNRLPASDLGAAERSALEAFLDGLAPPAAAEGSPLSVVLYSPDPVMTFCLTAVCKNEGFTLFATNEEADLGPIIERFLGKDDVLLLVLDACGPSSPVFAPDRLAALRRRCAERYPQLPVIQLVPSLDSEAFSPDSGEGAVTILVRPARTRGGPSFAAEAIPFLDAFPRRLRAHLRRQGSWLAVDLRTRLLALRRLKEPSDIALWLLRAAAETLPRALTLVVRGNELVAEKGIGIAASREREPAPVPGVRIPLAPSSPLQEVVLAGRCRCGRLDDPALPEGLFSRIGAPLHPEVLLLPLQVYGKTISLTYGDFGQMEAASLRVEPWEILAEQGGLVIENALYHKRLGTPSP